jgi:hypothetical protein
MSKWEIGVYTSNHIPTVNYDENNNGWVFNAMHSREGCYTYIKEIVKGESYMELGEEERESLKKAMKQ